MNKTVNMALGPHCSKFHSGCDKECEQFCIAHPDFNNQMLAVMRELRDCYPEKWSKIVSPEIATLWDSLKRSKLGVGVVKPSQGVGDRSLPSLSNKGE